MYSEKKKAHQKTEFIVSSKVSNPSPPRLKFGRPLLVLKIFFPNLILGQTVIFSTPLLSALPPFPPYPFPPTPIDIEILTNFTDTKHKVLEWKNKNEKGVHFYFKIANNYVIGWYFISIVYLTKNIYSIRNDDLRVWKCENLKIGRPA